MGALCSRTGRTCFGTGLGVPLADSQWRKLGEGAFGSVREERTDRHRRGERKAATAGGRRIGGAFMYKKKKSAPALLQT